MSFQDEVRDPTQPWSDRLGSHTGGKRDHSTEYSITVYGLDSLIRIPSRVCMFRSAHYLLSGQSDQSPAQSLDSLIRAWSRVWTILWYGLDRLNRALLRVYGPIRNFPRVFKSATNAIRQEITFETENTSILSKLKNGQNWKFLQVGTEILYTPPPPPQFLEGKTWATRVYGTRLGLPLSYS